MTLASTAQRTPAPVALGAVECKPNFCDFGPELAETCVHCGRKREPFEGVNRRDDVRADVAQLLKERREKLQAPGKEG